MAANKSAGRKCSYMNSPNSSYNTELSFFSFPVKIHLFKKCS